MAVASAEEPSVTAERVCQSVLEGVDVGVILSGLLDEGEDRGDDRPRGVRQR